MKVPIAVLSLAAVFLAVLVVEDGVPGLPAVPAAAQSQPPVTVALQPDGTVSVSPRSVTVGYGETVEWETKGENPFLVLVPVEPRGVGRGQGGPPPFANPAAHENGLKGRKGAPARAAIQNGAKKGTYKYSVVVWDVEAGELRALDPELIIE